LRLPRTARRFAIVAVEGEGSSNSMQVDRTWNNWVDALDELMRASDILALQRKVLPDGGPSVQAAKSAVRSALAKVSIAIGEIA
jgi:hypothetical protein